MEKDAFQRSQISIYGFHGFYTFRCLLSWLTNIWLMSPLEKWISHFLQCKKLNATKFCLCDVYLFVKRVHCCRTDKDYWLFSVHQYYLPQCKHYKPKNLSWRTYLFLYSLLIYCIAVTSRAHIWRIWMSPPPWGFSKVRKGNRMLEAGTLSSLSFIPRTNFDVSLFFSTHIRLYIYTTLPLLLNRQSKRKSELLL